MHKFGRALIFVEYLLIVTITWIAFDTVSYFFLPARLTLGLPEYRSKPLAGFDDRRYYLKKEPTRGFDIKDNVAGFHSVNKIVYRIFSNSLGCFDENGIEAFKNECIYFAGGSFVWGYAPYETKFATKFEILTGVSTAKCGVYGTGTRHQFDKFLSVTGAIGPTTVFVGFHDNDLQDDYAHPHTTVIDGWAVATAYAKAPRTLRLYRPDISLLEQEVASIKPEKPESRSWWSDAKEITKRYSLIVNVALLAKRSILPFRFDSDMRSKFGYSVYVLSEDQTPEPPANPQFMYRDTAFGLPNKRAFITWKAHAVQNNYRFIVILIPPKLFFDRTDRYVEFKRFLDHHKIEYVDLTDEFRASGLSSSDLYNVKDGHLNDRGNTIAGETLASYFTSSSQREASFRAHSQADSAR